MNRRGILGLIAGAGAAGPSLARSVFTDLARGPSLGPPPLPAGRGEWPAQTPQSNRVPDLNTPDDWRRALASKVFRAEYESLLYEETRRETPGLDPDIAVLRSLSPMAKITFQRQRIVARVLEQRQNPQIYERMRAAIVRFLGLNIERW